MIAVLGFGRSGTTWVQDIISKSIGSLLLFEPIHPTVTELSRRFSYSPVASADDSKVLKEYFDSLMQKRWQKKWLMRNTVNVPLSDVSDSFLDTLWQECSVAGFKDIRCNFMADWIHDELGAKVVFVVRHPLAVAASIKRRKNFWEFGWPDTYEVFLENSSKCELGELRSLIKGADKITDYIERIAFMWALTHAHALRLLKDRGVPYFSYEALYADPFAQARVLLAHCGYPDARIHPTYIFTPSMTTLKTSHGVISQEQGMKEKGAAVFWEGTLTDDETTAVLKATREFGLEHLLGPAGGH